MGHGSVETNTRGGRQDLARAGRGKIELVTVADTLGAAAHSCATAVVVVKSAAILATSPYGDD